MNNARSSVEHVGSGTETPEEGVIMRDTECCQSTKVGQIGTREDYHYEESTVNSLRVLL